MINRFAIGAALAAIVATPVLAGGYVATVVETAPLAVIATEDSTAWTGPYVGVNLNYGEGKIKNDNGTKLDGTVGAIRAGYDWQIGQAVIGLGAEYNFGNYEGTELHPVLPPIHVELKSVATVFARAGYAFNDKFLGYGLLGYTRAKLVNQFDAMPEWSIPADEYRETAKGATVGIGAEYRVNQNWSGYAEYAYTDFGKTKDEWEVKYDLSQIKIGINYRF